MMILQICLKSELSFAMAIFDTASRALTFASHR